MHLSRNAKNKKCIAGYFSSLFSHFMLLFSCFTLLFSLFAFHSILHQGRYSCKNWKDFVVYFFAALIKHEICVKCEKCIVSVPQNAKYGKCIANLTKQLFYVRWKWMTNMWVDNQSIRGDSLKSINFQVGKIIFKINFFNFIFLKSIAEVSQNPKMQFSLIHIQSGEVQSVLKF